MKLFKQTWFAILLCVIAVVGTTLLNTRVKFGALSRDVRASLYEADKDGVNIITELGNLGSSVDALIALASERDLDTAAAEDAARYLELLLGAGDTEASQLHRYYRTLMDLIEPLEEQLGELSLDSHDSATLQRCITGIFGIRSAIEGSGYNASVQRFLDTYLRFPTKDLAALTKVPYPELFN